MLGIRRELMIHSALSQRGPARRLLLASGIAAVALCVNPPAEAQQYGGGTGVTVDYGVLDQMGTPQTLPEGLRNSAPTTVYTQPYGDLQPYGAGTLQPYGVAQAQVIPVQSSSPNEGQLLPPPPAQPFSTLTVPYKPSPSVADENAPTLTPPPPATTTAKKTIPAPAIKPAEPLPKVATVAPTPPPAPQPPPAAVPAPVAPETMASTTPALDSGSSAANDAAQSQPSSDGAAGTAPVVEAVATSTTTETASAASAVETTTETVAATAPATGSTAAAAETTAAATAGAAAATAATDSSQAAADEPTTTMAAMDESQTQSGNTTTTQPAPTENSAPSGDQDKTTSDQPATAPAQDKTEILFPEGSAELPPEATQQLDAIATKLDQDQSLRLQLMAYASGTDDTASRARRISLSRALAVRAYLINKGVRSTRMDVRALGNKVEGDPADRVDIVTMVP